MENSCSLYLLSDESLWVEKHVYKVIVKSFWFDYIIVVKKIYIIIWLIIDKKKWEIYSKDVMKKPSDIGVSDGSS